MSNLGKHVSFFLSFFIYLTAFLFLGSIYQAEALPPADFDKIKVVDGLERPTAFRFVSNGDIYIGEQSGKIKILRNGSLLPTPLISLSTLSDYERGLWGLEIDPNFSTNGYIYVSYTSSTDNLDRLSRFKVTNDVADPLSELIFHPSRDPISNTFHHGNDVRVGPDEKTWWVVGDNMNINNPQSTNSLHGKVNRFDPDGSHSNDNPWYGLPNTEHAVWAIGLHNPFRFIYLPNGKPLVTDSGSQWEEFNIIEKAGNYGWPLYEGDCGSCGFINPVFAYQHSADPEKDGQASGLALYSGSTFPVDYHDAIFYGDLEQNFIRYLKFDSSFQTVLSSGDFDMDANSPVDLHTGVDGNLYYLSLGEGALYKIIPSGGNRTPLAKASADTTAGLSPLTVTFSSAGSNDPDADTTSYLWDFGDGASSTDPNPTHIFTSNGVYVVTLEVSDESKSNQASIEITVGNRAPTATITGPLEGIKYNVGSIISFSASANDPEDPSLPSSAYSWKVIQHHGTHRHPYSGPFEGIKSGSFTILNDYSNEANSWYTIVLTVTDSGGLKDTVFRNIFPNLINAAFQSSTEGAKFTVDGRVHSVNFSDSFVVGINKGVSASSPQSINSLDYRFSTWSDGGSLTHNITIPSISNLYQINFTQILPLPNPWQTIDIGAVKLIGSADATTAIGGFILTGAGSDIWGTKDEFRYLYQTLSGDGEISAQVVSQTNTNSSAKTGVMIKQSPQALSPYVMMGVTPSGYKFQWNFSGSKSGGSFTFPNAWVKLKRVGNSFTAYKSSNGTSWTQVGKPVSLTLNSDVTIGLFDTSHSSNALSTVVFQNVNVIGSVSPSPTPTPSPLPTPTPSSSPTLVLSNLQVFDSAKASKWSLQLNIQNGLLQYGDRTYTLSNIPLNLLGAPWIRTANASKSFTGNPTVTFTINQDASVYVAQDTRLVKPVWMDASWINTGLTLTNSDNKTFLLYAKAYPAGSVSLGPVTATSTTANMYTVIVLTHSDLF